MKKITAENSLKHFIIMNAIEIDYTDYTKVSSDLLQKYLLETVEKIEKVETMIFVYQEYLENQRKKRRRIDDELCARGIELDW